MTFDDFALLELLRSRCGAKSVTTIRTQFADFFRGSVLHHDESGFQSTFRKFKGRIELGKIRQPLRQPLWEIFLAIYNEENEADLSSFMYENGRFMPRVILVGLLQSEDANAYEAIQNAYRSPARKHHKKKKLHNCSDFEETFTVASEQLMQQPPLELVKNPALLYTYFILIFERRAFDACKKYIRLETTSLPEEIEVSPAEILTPRHISNETVDYVIEDYNLAELAGTDNGPSAIRWLLSRLEDNCEELLTLFYIKGWSYDAIGERTNLKATNVGKTKERCINKLTDLLAGLKRISHE